MSASTKQQNCANLLRLVDCIMPERRRLLNVRSYGAQDSAAPFTPDDLPMILRWPMEQRTAYRRLHNAAVLVHFILGAGLRHSELIHVTREDVVEDDLGVVVHVREGSNPRQVPVSERTRTPSRPAPSRSPPAPASTAPEDREGQRRLRVDPRHVHVVSR